MKKALVHPAAFIINFLVYRAASKYNPVSLIDVGGTGKCAKMQYFGVIDTACNMFSANIKKGYNGVNLHQIVTKSFDVSVSVATLEHVGGDANFVKFVDECTRVARFASIHWFPYGESAQRTEELKKQIGHPHPCILPSEEAMTTVCDRHSGRLTPCVSVGTHLMSIGCINKTGRIANNAKLYDFLLANEFLPYGYLLEIAL